MADFWIAPSSLEGSLTVPSSKSQTLRAILFGALASGSSKISRILPSPDTEAMVRAIKLLGAKATFEKEDLIIEGCAGQLKPPNDVIDCGNSGIVLRFIGALAGLIPSYTVLTGDASIRSQRPVKPLLSALEQLGSFAVSSREDGCAPLIIRGPLLHGTAHLDAQDSQPVSGLLIAASLAPHAIEIHAKNPGEKPWVDLTLHWLGRLGIFYEREGYVKYRVEPKERIDPFCYEVPGDWSTAAFPIAAALLTNSELTLHNIDLEDPQGDRAVLSILQKMGASFSIDCKTLFIPRNQTLQGMEIDVNDCIDALPILAVIGCFAKGETKIVNGAIARKKESDRIFAIATELRKMGADIEERPDGLVIRPAPLRGAVLDSYQDHRIALSLSVAALAASSPSKIQDIECIQKTYHCFHRDFVSQGARISL